MRVMFACGGTGGHINPAVSVAKFLKERRPESEIYFIGAPEGLETRLVPKEGFELKLVNISSFRRKVDPVSVIKNIGTVFKIYGSLRQAGELINEFKPDVVMGTGGYASFPVVYKAAKMKIPTIIHESNAFPGLATKMLAGKADRILVSFEESAKYYKRSGAVRVTGTPVREGFVFNRKEESKRELGLEGKLVLVSFMGSLGAREMNKKIAEFIAIESKNSEFIHIHSAGSYGYRWMPQMVADMGVELEAHPDIDLKEYIYDMPKVLAAADLAICRGGASTLSELAAAAKPAIIIPSPNVAENHQEKNARVLEARGAAVVVKESEVTGKSLYDLTREIINDRSRLESMEKNLKNMAILNATERIYETILELSRG